MGNYSKDIINKNGLYILKNHNTFSIIIGYIILLYINIYAIVFIGNLVININHYKMETTLFSILFFLIFYVVYFIASVSMKKITFDINNQEIIFEYGLLPFIKIKRIKIGNLNEISINYLIEYNNMYRYGLKEKIFNIDLIDNNFFSYRIYQSDVYGDDIINLSKEISEIINVKINDKNNVEGYKNIYNKNII